MSYARNGNHIEESALFFIELEKRFFRLVVTRCVFDFFRAPERGLFHFFKVGTNILYRSEFKVFIHFIPSTRSDEISLRVLF